jgi:hypothetical protein
MHNEFFSLSSPEIDQYFGLSVNEIEQSLYHAAKSLRPCGDLSNLSHVLHGGHQTWIGLEPETLQTPYQELLKICQHLQPKENQLMVDLGAGYGRLGLVLHHLYPGVIFKGYELVPERVAEGNRVFKKLNCDQAKLYTQDLTEQFFEIPNADFYFIYDFGKVAHIRETLKQIEKFTDTDRFKVVARGKGTRSIIEHEHPWLSQINPVIHEQNFSIYSF